MVQGKKQQPSTQEFTPVFDDLRNAFSGMARHSFYWPSQINPNQKLFLFLSAVDTLLTGRLIQTQLYNLVDRLGQNFTAFFHLTKSIQWGYKETQSVFGFLPFCEDGTHVWQPR